jgi:hypothetical protein
MIAALSDASRELVLVGEVVFDGDDVPVVWLSSEQGVSTCRASGGTSRLIFVDTTRLAAGLQLVSRNGVLEVP